MKRRRKRTSRLVSLKIVHYCKLFITECYEYEYVCVYSNGPVPSKRNDP